MIGKFGGFGGDLQNDDDDNKIDREVVRATFVETRPGRVAGRGLLERAKTRDDTVPFMITRQRQNSWFEVGTPTHTHKLLRVEGISHHSGAEAPRPQYGVHSRAIRG